MKSRVLCFGSLNIDFTYKLDHIIQKGETESSDELCIFTGGKGLNQSIALSKAGADVYHAGAVGEDGQFLIETLQKAGVHTEYIKILQKVRTGNAIIQNDRNGENCIILYGGANQAITRDQVDMVLADFRKDDYLILQNEINELSYIITKAHEKGLKIVLNPSPMNEKIMRLPLQYVDYFLLNEVEGRALLQKRISDDFGKEKMVKELAERFPDAGILLTLGEEGSIYMDKKQTFIQKAYPVEAVDTTAAGDTFTGFFIGGLLRGLAINKAMDQAAKASAIAVTRQGAAPSIPTLEEVESIFYCMSEK